MTNYIFFIADHFKKQADYIKTTPSGKQFFHPDFFNFNCLPAFKDEKTTDETVKLITKSDTHGQIRYRICKKVSGPIFDELVGVFKGNPGTIVFGELASRFNALYPAIAEKYNSFKHDDYACLYLSVSIFISIESNVLMYSF